MRQARNNYRIAAEQYEAQKEELQKLVQQAVQDREGYLKESIQMEKKVASDSLAYHVTRRKYEEGLMTSLRCTEQCCHIVGKPDRTVAEQTYLPDEMQTGRLL